MTSVAWKLPPKLLTDSLVNSVNYVSNCSQLLFLGGGGQECCSEYSEMNFGFGFFLNLPIFYIISVIQTTNQQSKYLLHFGSTNPCRITRKEFLMKQTKMYVCTLEEFILVDIWIHCCASWNWICIGNAVVYIQSQQWKRNVRIALRSQLTCED